MILLLNKLKLQEESEMASIISADAASVLRAVIIKWCSDHVSASNLQDAELTAEAVQKIGGQMVLDVSLSSQRGKSSKRGAHIKCNCGGKAPFEGYRNRWVRSACGEVHVKRAYYHCSACKTGPFPWGRRARSYHESVHSSSEGICL